MKMRIGSPLVAILAFAVVPAAAQQKPPEPAPAAQVLRVTNDMGPAVPVKVTVVVSRFQGEKRLSSMPYVMGVTARELRHAPKSTLRMGVDVPVIQTVFGGGDGKSVPQSSYTYRNVGTNIDCTAFLDDATPGVFQLNMTVSDTSVNLGTKQLAPPGVAGDIPTFRNFNSSFTAVLRDGQTSQYTSATDPVTGESMRIDVTLNVMK